MHLAHTHTHRLAFIWVQCLRLLNIRARQSITDVNLAIGKGDAAKMPLTLLWALHTNLLNTTEKYILLRQIKETWHGMK